MERCESCGSTNIKPVKTSLDYLGKVVEGVPALKCLVCGEVMVDSDALDEVARLVRQGKNIYQEGPVVNLIYGGLENGSC